MNKLSEKQLHILLQMAENFGLTQFIDAKGSFWALEFENVSGTVANSLLNRGVPLIQVDYQDQNLIDYVLADAAYPLLPIERLSEQARTVLKNRGKL
jgi:hypothetical protein